MHIITARVVCLPFAAPVMKAVPRRSGLIFSEPMAYAIDLVVKYVLYPDQERVNMAWLVGLPDRGGHALLSNVS